MNSFNDVKNARKHIGEDDSKGLVIEGELDVEWDKNVTELFRYGYNNLKKIAYSQNLTLNDLAGFAGYRSEKAFVRAFTCNHGINVNRLLRLCKHLSCKPSDIFPDDVLK